MMVCLGWKSRYIFVVVYKCSCKTFLFFLIDVKYGEGMRILDCVFQYVMLCGRCVGSDFLWAGVFFI